MIELVDAKLVGELSRIFSFPLDRIVWGSLYTAQLYWTTYLSGITGVSELPYMAFHRLPKFHDAFKKTESLEIIDHNGEAQKTKYIPIMSHYTVELIQPRIIDQTKAMKAYMLWAGLEAAVSFKDAHGTDWSFRVVPEDPEDNSDLEAEENQGRVIRSTFNFQVETILLELSDTSAPIQEILMNIHGYYDDIDSAGLISDVTIP